MVLKAQWLKCAFCNLAGINLLHILKEHTNTSLIAPAGFRTRGRNPRRHPNVPRVKKKYRIVLLLVCETSRFDETRRARWSRLIFSMCAWLSNRANWVCQRVSFTELCRTQAQQVAPNPHPGRFFTETPLERERRLQIQREQRRRRRQQETAE